MSLTSTADFYSSTTSIHNNFTNSPVKIFIVLLSQAVSLINHNISKEKSTWTDLGCGDGLFTNALSQLLPQQSLIYAVDKSTSALKRVEVKETIQLEKLNLNFVDDALPLENIDGILMANSFHFVKDKNKFIHKIFNCLNKDGYMVIVEYDTDKSNLWVPYPISFNKLQKFFVQYNCSTQKLNEIPSRYNGVIYAAIVEQN